jgi:hypothetical protein
MVKVSEFKTQHLAPQPTRENGTSGDVNSGTHVQRSRIGTWQNVEYGPSICRGSETVDTGAASVLLNCENREHLTHCTMDQLCRNILPLHSGFHNGLELPKYAFQRL